MKDIDISIIVNPSDIEIHYIPEPGNFFGARKGVLIYYKPTKVTIECTEGRSVHVNKIECFKKLKEYILNHRG